jgi:hypothetical protein
MRRTAAEERTQGQPLYLGASSHKDLFVGTCPREVQAKGILNPQATLSW